MRSSSGGASGHSSQGNINLKYVRGQECLRSLPNFQNAKWPINMSLADVKDLSRHEVAPCLASQCRYGRPCTRLGISSSSAAPALDHESVS